ncbi:MAG: hypothetical protein WD080_11835 [Egibacteraceae bacterium]
MGLPPPPGGQPPLPPPPAPGSPERPPPTGPGPAAGGAAGPGPIAVRPLNLGEMLDGAFKLLAANWRAILIVTAIFVVPMQLLSAYLQRGVLGAGLLDVFTDPTAADALLQAGGTGQDVAAVLSFVNGLVLTPLVTGTVAAVVATSYLGGTADAGTALASGLRRWWALIAAWVLLIVGCTLPVLVAGAVIGGAAVAGLPVPLVVVLGIVLVLGGLAAALAIGSLFAGAAPAIVVEQLGAIAGLRRSARLLRPRLLPVIGILVLASLLISVLSMALGGIPQLAGLLIGDRFGWVLVAVGGVLAGLITTPLLAIVVTLLYFDGRVRQEALDLRLTAEGLSAPDAGGLPAGWSS